MVGLGDSAGVGQDAEEFLHTPVPATAATSIPSPAPAPTPGPSATKPSGEQFMVWLKQGSMRPAIPPLQNDNNDVRRCAI